MTSFEAFRRLVLKELTKVFIYKNFHTTVRAFEQVGGLDGFAAALCPLLKSCWQLGKSVEFTAQRVDVLSEATKMASMLYEAEVKYDKASG